MTYTFKTLPVLFICIFWEQTLPGQCKSKVAANLWIFKNVMEGKRKQHIFNIYVVEEK